MNMNELLGAYPNAQVEENSALITLGDDFGGLEVKVNFEESQITVSTLIARVDSVKSEDEVNRALMRMQSSIPLSNVGIDDVDGVEWYVMFGEIRRDATVEELTHEVIFTAQNALEIGDLFNDVFKAEVQ